MQTNSENSEQKKSHIALLVSPIKGIVQEAALKPLRNAAVKVKEDVGLLVRDPKEFAKQKKCEVEDMVFPAVPDEENPEWQAKLAKQRSLHLKDFPRFMFIMVVLRATYLNFIGGFINAVCIAGLWGIGITHLTGVSTMASIRLVNPPLPNAAGAGALGPEWFFAMLAAFCLGSTLGGIITGDARYRWRGRQALTLLFESLFLIVSYMLAKLAASLEVQHTGFGFKWWGAVFICAAAGTQNSLTSNYTAIVVRSTHTTGLVVDIGMAIGQMIHTRSWKYVWKLQVWLPCLAGFCSGALLGAAVYGRTGPEALLFPVVLLLILVIGTWMDMGYKELRLKDRNVLGLKLRSKVTTDFKEF